MIERLAMTDLSKKESERIDNRIESDFNRGKASQ